MNLTPTRKGDQTIVTVNASRIDAASAIQFKDAMRSATADAGNHVILDLGQVAFIDSSGLGAIVAAMKLIGPDRRLDLAALTPDVDKVFRLTRMDTVFSIHGSLDSIPKRSAG
ncbi:STAS domain-containing protein [Pseudohalocynthiibacter aestuariivivens]|nr:STAS domain-containing protein [Pseudohalocynthiibacter aestuariivivens]QIE45627.1 STAS domain-containing protein [Pseudohalocynthiibacter aestuariivivens]